MGIEELFQTVKGEISQPIATEISGTIPEWIEGSLYRNGPGKFEFGNTKYNHWFDGMALIHRFKISKGAVTYQNRFLQSDTYQKNMKADRIVVSEFGTAAFPDPCKNLFQRFFSYFKQEELTDNTLVNLFPIGDALYTATETNFLNRIDPDTLERLDKVDLTKVVSVNMATAHPHLDPDGTYHNLGAVYGKNTIYTIIKITPPKKSDAFCEAAEIVAKVPAQWKMKPSYHHSFAMTENYYILIEQPLVMNVMKILTAKLRGVPTNTVMEWCPEHPVKFHIIDKKTGVKVNKEVSYQSEAFFTFHTINAYEQEGSIILDTVALGKESDVARLINGSISLSKLQEAAKDGAQPLPVLPYPRRYILPIQYDEATHGVNLVKMTGSTAEAVVCEGKDKTDKNIKFVMECKQEIITDTAMEFPQINYGSVNAKKYRYIYGAHLKNRKDMDSLVKIDTQTREVLVWHEENVYPSEPIFVATPGGTEEDDGVLLSVGLTTGENRCAYLLVLNARDMNEIGRANVDVKIGLGFHGIFLQKK